MAPHLFSRLPRLSSILELSGLRSHPRRSFTSKVKLHFEPLESRQLLAARPLLSEFVAGNQGGLRDGDGESSDWIEIFNAGDTAVDLAAYRLTDEADDLTKWQFPSTVLGSHDFLVVFASGATEPGYVDELGYLHTNFRLNRRGEYLALVAPDGKVISEYGGGGEDYPEQLVNVSYGRAQTVSLVHAGSGTNYWIPDSDRVARNWTEPNFDAAAHGFMTSAAALGLESRPGSRDSFEHVYSNALPDDTYGVYSRMEFALADASAVTGLHLHLKYDNGFVAYINGVRIAEDNAPDDPRWYSSAPDDSRSDSESLEFAVFDLAEHISTLVDGQNVLAIHGLNSLSDTSDMLLIPELVAAVTDVTQATGTDTRTGYMQTPTPGAVNGDNASILSGFVADVQFGLARGFYQTPQEVTISADTPGLTFTTPPTAANPLPIIPVPISTTILSSSPRQPCCGPQHTGHTSYLVEWIRTPMSSWPM